MGRWAVVSGAAIVLTVLLSTSVFANVQTRENVRALAPHADALVGPKILAPIGAAPPVQPAQGWNVTITNKASLIDYPVSVLGGEVYTAGIQMLLEIPSGHHGQVRIQLDVTGGFDPSEAARWVFFQPLYFVTFNLDEGTWGARYFMQAATPVVYRDSETTLTATVRLFENGVLLAQDQQPSYFIRVEPLVRAADVAFRGTVTDADLPAMGLIDLVRIAIDQVIADPTGELRPGKLVYVRSDDLIREDVVVRDIVEVRGDYHPAEDPKVVAWKVSHSITRVGTRNQAPFLTEPAISPSGGDDITEFVFAVQYADLDGDPPQVSIVLDGARMPMEFSRGLVTMDAAFRFAVHLAPGIHTYRFVADDQAGAPNSEVGTGEFVVVVGSSGIASGIIALDIGAAIAGLAVWKYRSRRPDESG